MDAAAHVEAKARAAKEAARVLALAPTRTKNEALAQMARGLEEKSGAILEANRQDLERARTAGHPRAFVDRLTLTESRIEEMAAGLRHVAGLPDPVGETVETSRRPSGLEIARVRVPLGVIGFIYESRPNVTADAAGLCLKSGNAVLLRGGSEALESNTMLAQILARAVEKAGLPAEVIQAVETADRAAVLAMLTLDRYLDLIIPRGGEEFVRLVAERSTVPVLKHDKGLCHLYVDEGADLDMAVAVAVNAKAQRVSVCNCAGDPARARGRRARVPARGGRPARARRAWRLRADERARALDARRPRRPSPRTGTRSTSTTSWRCGWWRASRTRSPTSGGTARGWPSPSSPATCGAPGASPRRWTRRRCSSTRRRGWWTAASSGWAPRWASPPPASTRGARSGCAS